MRLEEAAQVLGVPVDADCDTLKQAYRKRALECHPDKCKDPSSKARFQRISVAYTRLLTAHHQGEDDDEEYELSASGNPQGPYSNHDPNDVRAFMRMVMELVGMFNEGQMQQDGKYAFGVMLGERGHLDDCSSDDGDDQDLEDDDEDEELDEDELDSHVIAYAAGASRSVSASHRSVAERQQEQRENAEAEAKRKEKNAKKRKKQREKKQRDQQKKEEEAREKQAQEEAAKREAEEKTRKRKEDAQRRLEQVEESRQEMFAAAAAGNLDALKQIVEDTDSPLRVTDRMGPKGKTGPTLLHAAITGGDESSDAAARLVVVRYLVDCRNPALDLSAPDEQGMTILHAAAANNEAVIVQLLLEERRTSPDARAQIELNAKCTDRGWTPLHYAVSAGSADIVRQLVAEGALLNMHGGTAGAGQSDAHRITPLELAQAQANLAAPNSRRHKSLVAIVQQLEEHVVELERIKQQREAERRRKEEEVQLERERLEKKAQQEKELLERKQRQLREKQDKERKREEEAEQARQRAAMLVQAAANEDASSSSKKKKKRQKKKKDNVADGDSNHDQDEAHEAAPTKEQQPIRQPSPAPAPTSAVPTNSTPAPAPAPASDLVSTQPMFQSRDEIMDHLLAMGFSEESCYAALQKCGYQLDAALSYLCDTPQEEVQPASKAAASSEKQPVPSTQTASEAKRANDHAEEMRRINRAWNASSAQRRAEEERREPERARKDATIPKSPALQPQQQSQQPLQPQQHAPPLNSHAAPPAQADFHPPYGTPGRYHVMPPGMGGGPAAVPGPAPGMGFPMHQGPPPAFGPPGFGYPPGFHPSEQFNQSAMHAYAANAQHLGLDGHLDRPNGLPWAVPQHPPASTEAWGASAPTSPSTTSAPSNAAELSPRAQPFLPSFMHGPPPASPSDKQPLSQPLGLGIPSLVQQSQSEFVSTSLDDVLPEPWETQEFQSSSFLSMLGGNGSSKSSSLFGFQDTDFQSGEHAGSGGSLFSGSAFVPSSATQTTATSSLLGFDDSSNISSLLSSFNQSGSQDVLEDDLSRLANLLSQAGLSEDQP